MTKKVYTSEFKRSAITLVTEQKNKPDDPAATLCVNLGTYKFWLNTFRRNSSQRQGRRSGRAGRSATT